MPSVEGLPARRAALQMLDAVLRRGRTLDSAAQAVAGPEACRPGAGRRDCRRGAAANARPRRADRQRDAAAASRRQQGADGAADRARAEGRASELPEHALGRDRLAAGRRRTAAAGARRARHAPAPRRSADGRAAASGRGRATLEQGVGRGGRCIGAAADRQAAAARSQLCRRCGSEGLRRDHGRQVARDAPCPTERCRSRVASCRASARAAGGCRTSPPRCRRG